MTGAFDFHPQDTKPLLAAIPDLLGLEVDSGNDNIDRVLEVHMTYSVAMC